jgi:hypothetical protein
MTAVRLTVAVLVLLALGALVAVRAGDRERAIRESRPATADTPAMAVLRSWDHRRSAAYAVASPGRLRALYAPGTAAGASDVRLLQGYRSRGWRVVGMRMQVLAVTVLERGRDRWRVRVTDRLADAVAVRAGHRVPLPRDQATTRVVTLTRSADGRWRVAGVVAAQGDVRPARR